MDSSLVLHKINNPKVKIFNVNNEEKNYPTYEFQILRYEPNVVTEEFVNVGMVMFEPESSFLAFKAIENLDRIVHFFNNEVSKDFLQRCFETIANNYATFQNKKENLTNITNQILPKNDGALYFSDVKTGLKIQTNKNMNDIFEETYQKIVNQYAK